jgi:hypothetical protein
MLASELLEWRLAETIDPWGQARLDLYAARICEQILRSQGVEVDIRKLQALFTFRRRTINEDQADAQLAAAARRY